MLLKRELCLYVCRLTDAYEFQHKMKLFYDFFCTKLPLSDNTIQGPFGPFRISDIQAFFLQKIERYVETQRCIHIHTRKYTLTHIHIYVDKLIHVNTYVKIPKPINDKYYQVRKR